MCLNKISKENDVYTGYSCSGTAVDCVKLSLDYPRIFQSGQWRNTDEQTLENGYISVVPIEYD